MVLTYVILRRGRLLLASFARPPDTVRQMLFSEMFVEDEKYRTDTLQTCADDKPLVVQFCGNKPEVIHNTEVLCSGWICSSGR